MNKKDIFARAIQKLEEMTPEEREEMANKALYNMYGGKEGYDWAVARRESRETNVPESVSEEHFEVLEALQARKREVEEASRLYDEAVEDLRNFAARQTGIAMNQQVTVQVRKDETDVGIVYGYNLLDNGVILLKVLFQWNDGEYGLDDIVKIGDIVDPPY